MNGLWEWMAANTASLLWLLAAVALLVLEGSTTQMVSIWFSIGAFVAAIAALFEPPVWLQFLIFAVVSAAALLLTRRVVKDVLRVKKVPTNADSVIGQAGVVTQKIDNRAEQGRVLVGGLEWSARSVDAGRIEVDQTVVVRDIQGVKVIVEPRE